MSMSDEERRNKIAERVLKQGELRLQAQLTVALASDGRALSLATVLAAASTAAIGLAASWFGATPKFGIAWGALVTGLVFAGAGWLCGRAARPLRFALVGAQPEKWWSDGVEQRPLRDCLKKESRNYQRRIEHNKWVLSRNAESLRLGIRFALVAPIFGFLAWAVAQA